MVKSAANSKLELFLNEWSRSYIVFALVFTVSQNSKIMKYCGNEKLQVLVQISSKKRIKPEKQQQSPLLCNSFARLLLSNFRSFEVTNDFL